MESTGGGTKLTASIPKGKLYTTNPNGLKYLKDEAELWQIMRAGNEIQNALRVKELSPSDKLFQTYIKYWKDKPPSQWWHIYEKNFLQELMNEEQLHRLRTIYKKLLKGNNIVLICFCEDHRICHRRLVGDFFSRYGVEPIELNPVKTEQLSLF